MKFFFIVFVFGLSISTNAQINNVSITMSGEPLRERKYKDVQGSPYLTEDWALGKMIKKDNSRTEPILVRYNIYEDKVEYKFEGKPYILNDINVKGVEFTLVDADGISTFYIFEKGFKQIEEYNENSYFSVLYSNKVKFIQKITNKPTDITTTYGTTTSITKFIRGDKYFFVKEDGEIISVKRTNSAILKVLDNKEIDSYIKKNKLNIKNDKDLVMIFDFVSSKTVKE